jgi:hypothetical protein
MADAPDPDEIERRVRHFERYCDIVSHHSVRLPAGEQNHACPCCGFLTLAERGGYDICPVCFWEDDGQDVHDTHVVRGGPNGDLSLAQARKNFASFGACRERDLPHVRDPLPEEHPLRADP